MKKIILCVWIICAVPTLVQAAVEFRFVSVNGENARQYAHDRTDQTHNLEDDVVMSVNDMQSIESVTTSSGLPGIAIQFTKRGQQRLSTLTAENTGKTLAMLIENRVVMLVPIKQEINASKINFPIDTTMREISQYVSMMNADKIEKERQQVVQKTASAPDNVLAERLNQQTTSNKNPQISIVNKIEEVAKGLVGKKLVDLLFSNWPFVIFGLVFFLPILKKILASVFSLLTGALVADKSGAAQKLTKNIPLVFSRNRGDESARDKGQRLLGEGRFVDALKYLRPYVLQNPADEQAKALLMNAMSWSGMNDKSTKKSRRDDAHDARRKVESELLRAGTSSADNRNQSISSLKLDKTQALRMARSILEKSK